MDQLSNFISKYLKTCETVQKLNSKTIKAYRIDLSQFHTFMLPLVRQKAYQEQQQFHRKKHLKLVPVTVTPEIQTQNCQKEDCYFKGIFPLPCL